MTFPIEFIYKYYVRVVKDERERKNGMRKSSVTVGMILALLCFQCFTFSEVCIKWLTSDYSAMQMIFFISLVGLIPIGLPQLLKKELYALKTFRFHQHLIRTTFSLGSTLCCILALKYISISTFTIITYTSPFFGILLAYLILNERASLNRIAAIIVGFVGVFIIVDPESAYFNYGLILSLICTVSAGLALIYTKKMAWSESSVSITFWGLVIGLVISGLLLPLGWKTPSLFDCMVFLSIGFFRAIANLLLAQALKHAPATVVMPFDYSGLLWAMFFGYLIWGDIPTTSLYYGGTLIILAGLYLAYREKLDESGISLPVWKHAYQKLRKRAA